MIKNKNYVAIIIARGGSKGIPNKNIMNFCGKPLINWTIEHCLGSQHIQSIWVSSDSDKILKIAQQYNVNIIKRPEKYSDDFSSSESAWLHAVKFIENNGVTIDAIVTPQVTSPLREKNDINNGIIYFENEDLDSMFSSSPINDLFIWKKNENDDLISINYDYQNRLLRQDTKIRQIENGSFYIFKPSILKKFNNRLGGKIGCFEMDLWKMFEIDDQKDVDVCKTLMESNIILNKYGVK